MPYVSVDPATGEVNRQFANHADAEVEAALVQAQALYQSSGSKGLVGPSVRILQRLAGLVEEMGKRISKARNRGGRPAQGQARRGKGVLYGIAATLPMFLERGSGHIINISSVAGTKVFSPGGTVYSGTKFAVSAISEGLRHEVGNKLRVTSIAPGAVESDLKYSTSGTSSSAVMDFYKAAIPAATIARAVAFAIEQPDDVDINEIVLRPTAQEF